MGGCCSKAARGRHGLRQREEAEDDEKGRALFGLEEDGSVRVGEGGARVRLRGSCSFASMYTQQGWKGVNQDAMTLWEDFAGEKQDIFCGVFDGHGPLGHKVARYVRDALPLKLSNELKSLRLRNSESKSNGDFGDYNGPSSETGMNRATSDGCNQWLSSCKDACANVFEELDKELGSYANIDCICSGTTAVSIVKLKEHLVISNLGDSRAVLCTRDNEQRVPVQLTVDLKPNLPSEEERIKSCRGRVFALDEEPEVHRLWLPDEESPGLAMARAFGDFCLKDFGLISTPEVSIRKLTEKDEFVVLATDGVWDVLSNEDVIKIVSSAKRSNAANQLVDRAVRAWRYKHPTSKVDDCAAICLFLTEPSSPTKQHRALDNSCKSTMSSDLLPVSDSFRTATSIAFSSERDEAIASSKEEWTALQGVSRVNSIIKLPRFTKVLSWRKRSVQIDGEEEFKNRRGIIQSP